MGILQFKYLPKTHKMKAFLFIFGLVAKEALGIDFVDNKKITVDTRAPSTYQNCNCQCNSDTWTDGNEIKGNCKGRDRNGALFCYVSGSALCSCRDIQQSSFLPDNNGRLKYYSYEACTTPPRNQCSNYGFNQNLGDGDYPYCQSSGSYRPGGSSSYRPGGSSSYRPGGSSSSSYRPGGSSSSSYRPGRPGGSSSYRPGRPGGNRNPPRRPSLGDILSGVRNGGNSGSSDSSSSNGAIFFVTVSTRNCSP